MSDLKLEVGLKISDQEADQSIRTLQDKLKRLQQATGTEMSPQAQQQQAGQSRALQDMQKRYVEDLNNRYQQIQKTMTDIDKLYQNQMLGDKSRVAMQEKLLELKRQEKQIGETMKTAGVTPPGQQPPEERTGLDLLKTLGKIVASGAIAKGALNFAQGIVTLPGQTLLAEGAIRQAQMQPLQMGMQGRGYELAAFGQERGQAMGMARDQMENQKLMDRVGSAFGLVLSAAAGSLAAGGLGAAGGAAAYAGSNQRGMLSLGSMFGIGEDAYNAMIQKEGIQNFEAYSQALRYQDVSKGLGSDFLNKNLGGIVGVERATGLGDEALFGRGRVQAPQGWGRGMRSPTGAAGQQTEEYTEMGLIDQSVFYGDTGGRARFAPAQVMETITKLMQAGMSQRQLTEGQTGAGDVLALEQQGVRGATGIAGRLGQIGAMKSDEALIRLFAEGMNKSKVGEDLNRFMQVTVDLATKTGTFSGEIVSRVASSLIDDTDFALKTAAGVSQKLSARDESLEGLEGQAGLQAATTSKLYKEIFGDEEGKKVHEKVMGDPFLAMALTKLKVEDLADEDLAASYGAMMGTDAEGARRVVGGIGKEQVSIRSQANPQVQEALERRRAGKPLPQDLAILTTSGFFFEGATTSKEAQTMYNMMEGFGQETPIDDLTKARETLKTPPTGRVGESALRSKAVAESAMYEGFQEHREQFQKSAEAYTKGMGAADTALKSFNEAIKDSASGLTGLGNVLKSILTIYNENRPAGSPEIDMSSFEPRTSVTQQAFDMGRKSGFSAKDM